MSKVLVIGYVWPEPSSSAAGTRMMQLLNFFREDGHEVLFCTTARETENMADLASLDIPAKRVKLNDPEFDDLLKDYQPDIVLFDRFMMEEQFGWRVDNICPQALKILDTEDLHFLRNARQMAFKMDKNIRDLYFEADLSKREIAAIYRCDLSLIISEVEMELLVSEFRLPAEILMYLPYLLDRISDMHLANLPSYEERRDFISIGNFLHEPNWNAVLYLKEKIWPKIRQKLPDAKMQIYGAYPSEKVYNLHDQKSGFIVNGRAEDSAQVMQNARICLAPIRFGAGLKGKLIEAMQNGTPSVTTSTGAEGINGTFPWNGFITDSEEEFIERAVELYSDHELWKEKQSAGLEIINSRFDRKEFQKNFRKRIQDLKNDLVKHRHLNFTGEMLKHHLHRSTYFMSRFIEEKNRNKN